MSFGRIGSRSGAVARYLVVLGRLVKNSVLFVGKAFSFYQFDDRETVIDYKPRRKCCQLLYRAFPGSRLARLRRKITITLSIEYSAKHNLLFELT